MQDPLWCLLSQNRRWLEERALWVPYWFGGVMGVTMANEHKPGGLKQLWCIVSWFWMSEVLTVLVPIRGSEEKRLPLVAADGA